MLRFPSSEIRFEIVLSYQIHKFCIIKLSTAEFCYLRVQPCFFHGILP